ncbi:hypothetical protein [Haloarcula sp. CGMCC 1.6347]|uniref:hypothetical protein n=1 Tax=Haloarcula sp. CGMCC 1.6347 TaxID=3111455 RepID=UPI00300ED01A
MTGLPTWADGHVGLWSWKCPECGDKWQDDMDGETVTCHSCNTGFSVTLQLTPSDHVSDDTLAACYSSGAPTIEEVAEATGQDPEDIRATIQETILADKGDSA